MESAIRLGDVVAQSNYPLPLTGRAEWTRSGQRWHTSIHLGECPAGCIIVPSFAQLYHPAEFQFTLHARAESAADAAHAGATAKDVLVPLHPVPSAPPDSAKTVTAKKVTAKKVTEDTDDKAQEPQNIPPVTAHIDCWHTNAALQNVQISLSVDAGTHPAEMSDYLLCVTSRALEIEPPTANFSTGVTTPPLPLSQMQAEAAIRQRICSPTALAMALSRYPQPPAWDASVEACFDPLTRAYGAWPLAIRWAARCGIVGAVEVFSDWHEVATILQRDTPIVCSIRFDKDHLRGAPLTQTGGHLVTLTAVTEEHVHVYDPAAPDHDSVARRYRLDEFSQAWLKRRGAAYIFGHQQLK
ncbi:MAG: C39 family peptidase [Pseudomonadota bacterium]